MPAKTVPRILKTILGMNNYDDSTSLQPGIVKLIQNMLPRKTSLDTREGWAKYNTIILPTSSGVFGIASYSPTLLLNLELAVSNGKLYSGDAGVFTERYPAATGLPALHDDSLCSIVQFDDTAIVCDQVNKMVAYRYGDDPYIVGIDSPKDYKLIENFDSAAAWAMVNGTATNDKAHQIYGTQCVDFRTTGAVAMSATKTPIAALNLNLHSDGSVSSASDYISLYFIRGVAASYTNCYLDLSSDGFTTYFSIRLDTRAEWLATSAPNVAFEFKIRKSAFIDGVAGSVWTSITGIRLRVTSTVIVSSILDFCRLEKTGPIPTINVAVGNLTGTYWYRVTYMTVDGWESDPSVTSDLVTVTAQKVDLSLIPIPGSPRIASKKIYRLGGTSAEWRLLTILYGATTTTYTDNTLDTDLGDIEDEVEGYPYIPKTMVRHARSMVIANLKDLDGTEYPCGIITSREESTDIYDHLDFFENEPNNGAAIKWLLSTIDFVYVGKNDSIWKFDPQDLTLVPRLLSRIYSGVGPLAVCAGENEFYFLDPNGVVSFNGSFFDVISDSSISRGTSIKNYLDLLPPDRFDTCWMLYFNNFVLVGIPQTGNTHPTLILAYYVPKRLWLTISGWNARCGYAAKIAGINTLHLGHATTGFTYNCFTGNDDDGTDITSIIQTADDDFDTLESRKDFAKLILWARKLTTTDVPLTIEPYLDTVDSTKDITETITSTVNKP